MDSLHQLSKDLLSRCSRISLHQLSKDLLSCSYYDSADSAESNYTQYVHNRGTQYQGD